MCGRFNMNYDLQAARAQDFRKMHDRTNVLLLPNAWDAVTARLLAQLGFPAIATTSGGVAWALGYPDGELAPLSEVLAVIRRIAHTVAVPVTADIESGYGTTPKDVSQTVRAVIDAGAVGINLEDSLHAPAALRDVNSAADRIRAARAAANAAGVPIVINARIDTYLLKVGDRDNQRFDETVRRAKAYLAAGADCVFPITLSDGPTLGALVAAIDAPVNVAPRPGLPPIAELQRLGIARVSTATRLVTVALAAIERAVKEVRETGRFEILETAWLPHDVQHLMGAD
jgi:2-methylisocitrate lyase-like PEP mutase family enzyme